MAEMCHYQGLRDINGMRERTRVSSDDEFLQGGVGLEKGTDIFKIYRRAGYVVLK